MGVLVCGSPNLSPHNPAPNASMGALGAGCVGSSVSLPAPMDYNTSAAFTTLDTTPKAHRNCSFRKFTHLFTVMLPSQCWILRPRLTGTAALQEFTRRFTVMPGHFVLIQTLKIMKSTASVALFRRALCLSLYTDHIKWIVHCGHLVTKQTGALWIFATNGFSH